MTTHAIDTYAPTAGKRDAIIYWTTTTLVAAVMIASAYYFYFTAAAKDAFVHLGLPNYFRVELTLAKLLGGLALLIPSVPHKVKEFAYFGCGLTILSAPIAHTANGDGIAHVIDPLIIFGILAVSYVYYGRRRKSLR
jgi:hypothetical protein